MTWPWRRLNVIKNLFHEIAAALGMHTVHRPSSVFLILEVNTSQFIVYTDFTLSITPALKMLQFSWTNFIQILKVDWRQTSVKLHVMFNVKNLKRIIIDINKIINLISFIYDKPILTLYANFNKQLLLIMFRNM